MRPGDLCERRRQGRLKRGRGGDETGGRPERRAQEVLPPHGVIVPRTLGPVRVALMIEGQEGVTWEQWCALADACEEHGIETLFRSDHYISQANEEANVAHDA